MIAIKTETKVLLLPVEYFDRKKDAEMIENSTWDIHQLEAIDPRILDYNMSDFMDLCNDQEFNIENYWVSYIQLIPD